MRFLLYNIRYGTGHGLGYHVPLPFAGFFRQCDRTMGQIVEFIKSVQPDVVALVEVDSGSRRSSNTCQADLIARHLNHFHVVEPKYGNGTLASRIPMMNKQSNALLTNQSISNYRFHYFEEGVKKLVIEVELAELVILIVHLSLKFRIRQQQLEHLHRLIKAIHKPVVVAGDFNTFGGKRELELFLAATGLQNANINDQPSHPSHAPKRHLDFILYSQGLEARNFFIPDIRLSDHAPLVCDFHLMRNTG